VKPLREKRGNKMDVLAHLSHTLLADFDRMALNICGELAGCARELTIPVLASAWIKPTRRRLS
jgi:hypothetical protein